MARKSTEGELQLGFDMAPILPKPREESNPRIAKERAITKRADVRSLPSPPDAEIREPEILSVAQLTRRITSLLEREIGDVRVQGEISNFRRQSSGHCYFTLKDAESQLPCVLFARAASLQTTEIRDGMQVCLSGDLSVYMARGQYQLIVRTVEATGEGALRARFEELKRRLEAEGLFDPERKRPLPRYPRRIGVVTSPTGAALQDFLQVLHRRHPGLAVVIAPVRVQGRGAAEEIAAAISQLASGEGGIGLVDIIVVTRGGGSLEDLWEFNEETVARAISTSTIPVVSAVGHEIDFTIADFAADLRAPTPSAAAELIAADGVAVLEKARSLTLRIAREAAGALDRAASRTALAAASDLFREPRRRLEGAIQEADRCEEILFSALSAQRDRTAGVLENLSVRLRGAHPGNAAVLSSRILEELFRRLNSARESEIHRFRQRLERCSAVLAAVDPAATLARGFSITRAPDGRVVTSASQVKTSDKIHTQFAHGGIESQVLG
jgi:exodeoxyribonuclease VII large subunit